MDPGEQIAAEILEAIRSGQDLWVSDVYITGDNQLERVRRILKDERDACRDPDNAAFLTSIIDRLEVAEDAGPETV